NPKPETRNPKPETRNPKPETRNPKPETRNPKPETRNLEPETSLPTLQASEVHRVLIALGCILPNQCEVGVFSTRLHQYGALWHQSSRPTWLIQKVAPNHAVGVADGNRVHSSEERDRG
ncbi:hypothetical protein T484DRAFT_1664431, partial [Baffinella frigidus]